MAQVIPVNVRPVGWRGRNGQRCSFHPLGKREQIGYLANREVWESDETWSARFFVGFNVGHDTVYAMEDLIAIVRAVREAQTGDPSSSFLYQRGIYKHKAGDVVEEPGAQAIIINMGETPTAFRKQMIELAEVIAKDLHQEEVVLELQRNGVLASVMGVAA